MRGTVYATLLIAWALSSHAQTDDDPGNFNGITAAAFIENCLDENYDFNAEPLAAPSDGARRLSRREADKILPDTALKGDVWDIVKTTDGPYLFQVMMYVRKDSPLAFSGSCQLYSKYVDRDNFLDFFEKVFVAMGSDVERDFFNNNASTSLIYSGLGARWYVSITYPLVDTEAFMISSFRIVDYHPG